MKMTFRWYGEKDCIPLSYIRQIQGVSGVVTAVYDTPVGEEWKLDDLLRLKRLAADAGLETEVIESVPVHEDIKLGKPSRVGYTEAYKRNIETCAAAGVKCICYNFMPVFDWLRTDLKFMHADGANSLRYDHAALTALDPNDLHLPGWDESYSPGQLGALLAEYKGMTHERLFENLVWFLKEIIPVCERTGVNMAIHPDDPPWDIFGLPRLLVNEESIGRFVSMVDDPYNALTLCSGSLGANPDNNVAEIVRKYCDRIAFAHVRNVKHFENGDFSEASHRDCDGDTGILDIMKAYHDCGFDGYMRPDHGRHIWGEKCRPGYGLYDRALGIMYLLGIWDTLEKYDI